MARPFGRRLRRPFIPSWIGLGRCMSLPLSHRYSPPRISISASSPSPLHPRSLLILSSFHPLALARTPRTFAALRYSGARLVLVTSAYRRPANANLRMRKVQCSWGDWDSWRDWGSGRGWCDSILRESMRSVCSSRVLGAALPAGTCMQTGTMRWRQCSVWGVCKVGGLGKPSRQGTPAAEC